MDREFEIRISDNGIILEKEGAKFSIEKRIDGDIWFCSSSSNVSLPIRFGSRNQSEYQSYTIFEDLMKSIVGRYILTGDDKDEYRRLPKDFINLETKTIIWHSDSQYSNRLQLQFGEEEIVVSITKDQTGNDRSHDRAVGVRIRTSGSDYGNYYQEFEKFFCGLFAFANQIKRVESQDTSTGEIQPTMQKRRPFFRKTK